MGLCQPGRLPGGGVQAPHGSGRWPHRMRLVSIHPPQPRAWPWQAPPRGPPGLALGPPTRVLAGPAVTPLAESTHAAQGAETPHNVRSGLLLPTPHQPALSLNRCFSLGCECCNHPNLGGPHPGAVGTKLRLSCPEAEGGRRGGKPRHTSPRCPSWPAQGVRPSPPDLEGAGWAQQPPAQQGPLSLGLPQGAICKPSPRAEANPENRQVN